MLNAIIGLKQKMGSVYVKDRVYPVTWVKVDPCVVTQIKHEEKDGYIAVQLGVGSKSTKNISKPLQNHLKNVAKDKKLPRYLREIKVTQESELKVGDEVKMGDVLKKGDIVAITGISKGKGFAGGVRRWGFAGGPKTHGQSDRERAPGSIGQRTTPGRIYKGKKMAGRMGSDKVTVKNVIIVDSDEKNNLVAITGAVPGAPGALVFIKKIGEGGVMVEDRQTEVTSEITADEQEEKEEVKAEVKEEKQQEEVSESAEKKSGDVAGEEKEEVKSTENQEIK